MKTQDFVKEVSDRNSPIKKLAEKMVSNIDSANYFRNDASCCHPTRCDNRLVKRNHADRFKQKIILAEGRDRPLVQIFFVEIRKKRVFFRRFSSHFVSSIDLQ